MSEIICRLHVDVWVSERPAVAWWRVEKRNDHGVFYKTDKDIVRRVSYRRLDRVSGSAPGVCEYWWVQPDNERIDGGAQYRKGMTAMMQRIQEDMLRASGRIRELLEILREE